MVSFPPGEPESARRPITQSTPADVLRLVRSRLETRRAREDDYLQYTRRVSRGEANPVFQRLRVCAQPVSRFSQVVEEACSIEEEREGK